MQPLTDDQVEQNNQRADRGREILDYYQMAWDKDEPYNMVVVDLLADLFHACGRIDRDDDNLPIDLQVCLAVASDHYQAELRGDD